MPEYATLKAMGYSQLRLARVVVMQSLIYMLISYVIAILLAIFVYRATEDLAGIPMRLTIQNLLITLALAIRGRLAVGFSFADQAARRPAGGSVLTRSAQEPRHTLAGTVA